MSIGFVSKTVKGFEKTEFRYEIVTLFLPDKNGNDLSENDSWKSEFYFHTNNSYLKHYHWFCNLKCEGLKSFFYLKKGFEKKNDEVISRI